MQINSFNCLSENLEPKLGPKSCIKKVGQSHVPNDARGNVDKGRAPDYRLELLTAKNSLPLLILDVLAHIGREVTAILLESVHRVADDSETLGSFLDLAGHICQVALLTTLRF